MTKVETVTEWCSNCEHEVELTRERKWHDCPNCNEPIAPCAQYHHGENGIHDCVCEDEKLNNFKGDK